MGKSTQYQFGDFVFCLETRRLLREGHEVHLSPKTFELLKVLVTSYPRAISKTELHDCLWPGIFVSEGNLALLISELRDALRDDARDPRFVRTLPGFGYAFRAAVSTNPPTRTDLDAGETSYWLTRQDRSFRLQPGVNVIGRHPAVDVVLDLPGVSRRHARITIRQDGALIEDLGSKNGTLVGGERIHDAVALEDHARVQIGPAELTYRVVLPIMETETLTISDRHSAS
jgi:DNA-binding winged helix-turn-helix (wHTH) protein